MHTAEGASTHTYTLPELREIELAGDVEALAKYLRDYLDSLAEVERANLLALVEMYPVAKLRDMAEQALELDNEAGAFTTVVAAIIKDARGQMEKFKADLQKLDEAQAAVAAALRPAYELPVLSLSRDTEVYDCVAKMQRGNPLRKTKVQGWGVLGQKASENLFISDAAYERMRAAEIIVPAPGEPWNNPRECYLSAIGWRAMGCLYSDLTAKAEARVYELAGTPEDTDTARRYRAIFAEWRARQARRATTPAWDKYSEFTLTIPEKVTGDGVKTVTVVFETGRPSAPDVFEFHGDVNAKGYHQHGQTQGTTLSQTVTQRAYDLACDLCAAYAAECKAAKRAAPKPKPVAPLIKIVDEGEDADELAAELGLFD